MAIITITSTINYAYLMNKSKSDLAHMYLALMELRVKDESALAALETELRIAKSEATQAKAQAAYVAAERAGLKERAGKLAEALEKWINWHDRVRYSGGIVFADGENPEPKLFENVRAALSDYRQARRTLHYSVMGD